MNQKLNLAFIVRGNRNTINNIVDNIYESDVDYFYYKRSKKQFKVKEDESS